MTTHLIIGGEATKEPLYIHKQQWWVIYNHL